MTSTMTGRSASSTSVSWPLTGRDNMRYLLLILVLLIPHGANAASLRAELPERLGVGDTAPLTVTLTTDGDIVNAVDGALRIPATLNVVEVRLSGSIVPFWVETPAVRDGLLT